MKNETSRISSEQTSMKEKIKENTDKIKVFKVLPYLVSNVVEVSNQRIILTAMSSFFEYQCIFSLYNLIMYCVYVCMLFLFKILDIDPQDQAEEDGGHTDLDSQRKGKCVVIKTSTRQVMYSWHLRTYTYSIPLHCFLVV